MAVKIRERDGKWWIYIDHNNKRKAKKVGTKEAAEKLQKQIEARLIMGDLGLMAPKAKAAPPEPTFAEYQKTWLQQAPAHCKDSTVAYYKDYQDRYIVPRFGSVRLSEIDASRIKAMIAELKTKGLARNTIRLAVASLRSVLSTAVEEKLISENPAKGLGRKAITSNEAKREARSMEPEEATRFLNAAIEVCPDYFPLFLIALRAGLRQGEILGLRWQDFEFEDKRRLIRVERRCYRGSFDTPKGNRSRHVDMSAQLRGELLRLRDRRLREAEGKGKSSIADDLVFPGESPARPVSVRALVENSFEPTLAKAKLDGFTFHDLRHTYGSLLLDAGVPLSYVSEQMGHSSILVTASVYAHALRKNTGLVNRLDAELAPQQSATQPQPEPTQEILPPVSDWCERGDSNPHGFTRQILSLVRLPIPPLSHA
jgi:integrase